MAGGLEDEETDGGQDSGGGGVEDALESVDAKGIGEGKFVLAGDEQRAERLSGAAQQKERAEAGEVHGIDIPEVGRADMGLEPLPAPGPNGIAEIDGHNGEKQVGVIGAADGVPELHAAELAEVQEVSRMVEEEPKQNGTQAQKPPFPRLSTHEAEEYWWWEGGVKYA